MRTPTPSSSWRSSSPAPSFPAVPTTVQVAPSAATLAATFPAPPTAEDSSSTWTTGTGASGEMRSTRPEM